MIGRYIGNDDFYILADEPRVTVARLKSRYSTRDPSLICGNYRLQNNRVNTSGILRTDFYKYLQVVIVAKRVAQRATIMSSTQRRGAKDVPPSDIEQTINMVRIVYKTLQIIMKIFLGI